MEFLRSVLANNEAVVASTRVTYDLPVNPLSHVLVTLRFLNDTGTITDYTAVAAALLSISNIAVEFKGTSVLNGSFADLAILSQILLKYQLMQVNLNEVDNDARAITVILPMGRKLYDPNECFPAVKRGDLRLVIDYAAAQTGINTLYAQIETVELLGATPKAYMKVTTQTKTPAATGDNDIDLPIGNPIAGILLWGTTTPSTDYTSTIGRVKLLVDNVEYGFSETIWESLHNELGLRFTHALQNDNHQHWVIVDDTVDVDTLDQATDGSKIEKYAYLDFDPNKDDMFLLPTEGKSRVHLRVNAGDTNALRVLPVELIGVGG
jgi:hypothetical protein